jgi:hypothetical protein
MALQAIDWSLNALSVELKIDRRSLAARLSDLPPVVNERRNGKIVRRWRLHDVVAHLQRGEVEPTKAAEVKFKFVAQRFICNEVFPRLIESEQFLVPLAGYAHSSLNLTKAQSLDLVAQTALFIAEALAEGFDDPDLEVSIFPKGTLKQWADAKARGSKAVAQFLNNQWPD